jgi:DNA-binding transcriptional LysR family regulator
MDNLGDVRLFVEAAQLGSLSAAGRKLGLTPAAASARLTKLETGLKARLFERTTRQLRLTDEGRLYLNCCRQALKALDDAEALLQEGQSVVRGKVRISADALARRVQRGLSRGELRPDALGFAVESGAGRH